MVKSKFLVKFPVVHLVHPVVYSLKLFWHEFAAFDYNVIDHFISITT